MIRKCLLLVVLDATDLLGSTKSACSAARVMLRTTSMMVRRFSNKVEARTVCEYKIVLDGSGKFLTSIDSRKGLLCPSQSAISKYRALRLDGSARGLQLTGNTVYCALGTHASNHPPCSSSPSAFSLVMDLQNSCVLTSQSRALSSAYTSNKLSSPKHTRSSRPGPPGIIYNLMH